MRAELRGRPGVLGSETAPVGLRVANRSPGAVRGSREGPPLTFQEELVARWPILLADAKALPVSGRKGARIRESWRFLSGVQVRS